MSTGTGTPPNRRHCARELLVKALYQWQLAGHSEAELRVQFAAMPEYVGVDKAYFRDVLARALRESETLDREIAERGGRSIDHIDAISRAVLIMGLAELQGRSDVPTKVIINESVELAKRYGPADCYRFVNAVLDSAAKRMGSREQ